MIIGRMSIDPKLVIGTHVSQDRGRWYLTVKCKKDNEIFSTDDYFDSESTALRWQEQLDVESYKEVVSLGINRDDNNGLSFWIL
jgi:hypothetical protein